MTALPAGLVRVEEFAIPRRGDLETALAELDQAWEAGPYGDWDSALLAPRERDLWEVPSDGPAMRTYGEMAGSVLDPSYLRLYRAWYHLAETGTYVHQFRQPHTSDLNDAEAWSNFLFHVPSRTNWPELSA